ncbi:hypothetical protein DPMN_045534 [Dreissena polymorpha]|uniref:Uncharacterized protein n=1 Tax=Dreissena polymorpha TaxID=45954 RepID=A0A9D4D6Q4_DREPO|nr:hypothetical protein DPMN_045534 [Dreissena polymorpha]
MYTLQVTEKGIPPQTVRERVEASSATANDSDMSYSEEEKEAYSEEEEEEPKSFLTREHCLGLPPSARVMKGRQSCKYNDK